MRGKKDQKDFDLFSVTQLDGSKFRLKKWTFWHGIQHFRVYTMLLTLFKVLNKRDDIEHVK